MQQSKLIARKNSLFHCCRNSGNLKQKLWFMRLKQIPVKEECDLKKIHNRSVNWSPLARPAGDTGDKVYHNSPQSLTSHGPHTATPSALRNSRFSSPTSLTDWRLNSSCQSFLGTPHKVFSNPAWAGAPPRHPHGGNSRVLHTWSLLFSVSVTQLRSWIHQHQCLLNPELLGSIQALSDLL